MLKHIDEDQLKDKYGRPASPSYFDEISKNVKWYHKVLLHKPLKVILVMVIAVFVIPPLVYLLVFQNMYLNAFVDDGYSLGICSHAKMHRVQCGVEPVTEEESECARFCCYDVEDKFCYHTVPSRYSYISNTTWTETKSLIPRVPHTPYDRTIPSKPEVKLHMNEISSTHINFILYDSTTTSYPDVGAKVTNTLFTYKIYYPEIYFEIFSKDEAIEKPLLSTARGALVATDDFWEWNFIISDDELYGLGDIKLKPKIIYNIKNESNAYPFIMGQRNGSFHGIYIEHSGPLELNYTESMVMTVKSLGGNELGVHFFYGPKPEDVVKQFREYIGEPIDPPYWAYGVHFCRGNLTSSKDLTKALENFYLFSEMALSNGIPYDSDCIADGIFDFINYQINDTMMENILVAKDYMNRNSVNFMPTLRPHVHVLPSDPIYLSALASNILFIDYNTNTTYQGKLDNYDVVIPDYSLQDTVTWLSNSWRLFNLSSSFVFYDNWAHVDVDTSQNCSLEHIYSTDLINKTVCKTVPWDATSPIGEQHKNIHNYYGSDFVYAIRQIEESAGGFIMTASSTAGVPAATFEQNVMSSWDDMKTHFTRAVWGTMQGNYMHSVPVCGTYNITNENIEAVCIKWYLASSFLPVLRVHSNEIQKHPLAFSGHANNIMQKALKTRYKLLPYMFEYLAQDKALLRPMFYEFWNDNKTYSLDEQFMVGRALMIAPNFRIPSTSVFVYIPENETMFDLWGGEEILTTEQGWIEIPTLENEIITLMRAGHIIPIQDETFSTAVETRQRSKIKLIVAMKWDENNTGFAEGSMYVSNNVTWSFTADERSIYINPWQNQSPNLICNGDSSEESPIPSTIIDRIRIYGLNVTNNNNNDIYYEVQDLNINLCDYSENYIIEHQYSTNNNYHAIIV